LWMRWALSMMLNIRGTSTVEDLLTGVSRFGHGLTIISLIHMHCSMQFAPPVAWDYM
jgi:hypothetical protein